MTSPSPLWGGGIAIVSPFPDSQAGGIERFCHLLAAALQSAGWDATVTGWPVPDAPWDLVITNGMLGGPVSARRIHVYHGSWVGHQFLGDPVTALHRRLRIAGRGAMREIRAGKGATRVAVSGSAAREIERFYRLRVHHVIPNAVDTEVFHPRPRATARESLGWPQETAIGLFAGRAEIRKQPDLAVAAAHSAGLELWVAGPTAPPGADRHIGILDPSRMSLAFAAADCVLAPSLYEACSLTVLEALAAGAPLVTSRVGWVPDLLRIEPSFRTLTAARADDVGFQEAVVRALANPSDADGAARYVRTRLNVSAWGQEWASLVREVLH